MTLPRALKTGPPLPPWAGGCIADKLVADFTSRDVRILWMGESAKALTSIMPASHALASQTKLDSSGSRNRRCGIGKLTLTRILGPWVSRVLFAWSGYLLPTGAGKPPSSSDQRLR
jgi:hypothetical protein